MKDTYGNETTETYTFTIEAAEAAKAAVSVTPQGESPVIGKPYLLKIENQSKLPTEYVDAADVVIEIGNELRRSNQGKSDVAHHIRRRL